MIEYIKIKDMLTNPPSTYRPVPFWSWNSKLDAKETAWQVDEMNGVGMGGFFMHARGGLKTPYLSEEWMDNIRAAVREADKLGMHAWGYDENGWPSGFGSDAVNSHGVEYQQKYLRMEITDAEIKTERTIINLPLESGKNAHFYYDINPFYVDVLDPKVTDAFIESTHEKYKKELGEDFCKLDGFFTDEPQLSRNGLPWSFILDDEYKNRYGESLLPRLCDLFINEETGKQTRFRFWKLVTELFSENFMGRIYKWCNENGVRLTGHMVCEETLESQLECNGAVMPNYEYMHIPGIDKLFLSTERNLLTSQVASVCAQLGKKQILTESFACCGWDVTFEELKHLYEWQMVRGVNLLCQHLAGYSLEGIRKRDYPAGHFYQNPWWKDYNDFNDFASRMGMLLAEGQIRCDVLVLHTMSSAWMNWCGENKGVKVIEIQNKLIDVLTSLDKNQMLFHLGDDRIMQKYAKVENSRLVVGNMSYSTIIVPYSECIDINTFELLEQFSKTGGNLIFVETKPEYVDGKFSDKVLNLASTLANDEKELLKFIPSSCRYCEIYDKDGNNADVQYAYRVFDDFEMYYLVNTFSEKTDVTAVFKGKSVAVFNYLAGETEPVHFEENDGVLTVSHTLEKAGSVVFFVRRDSAFEKAEHSQNVLSSINDKLKGRWEIARCDDNVITLDYCDLYFDGELKEKHIHVAEIQQLACDLERKVRIAMDFDIDFDRNIPDRMNLVLENPDQYTVYINGKIVKKNVVGYYRDKSFIMLDVTGLFEKGYNILTLECTFVQSQEVYETLAKCVNFESVKNKLCYDMEIEPAYLIGEFCVNSSQPYENCSGDGLKTYGKFSLTKRTFNLTDGDIAPQGYPFFCGSMTLRKTISLPKDETEGRCIEFSKLCGIVTKISVNGKMLSPMYWAPYVADLRGMLVEGDNIIEIEFITSFRNMFGPHHLGKNTKFALPSSFFNKSRIWSNKTFHPVWEDDSYSFSGIGIFLK